MINWDKPLFNLDKPTPFWKLLKQASKTADKAEKFLNKINSAKLASINRAKSIPPKKCNNKKRICQMWKDSNKKLKKKYIGRYFKKGNYDNNNKSTTTPENTEIINKSLESNNNIKSEQQQKEKKIIDYPKL